MANFGEFRWAEKADGTPIVLNGAKAPGESGVSVARWHFREAAHFSATTQQHLIYFQLSPHLHLECRMAGRRLRHATRAGALAICPAGVDCSVTTDTHADGLIIAIKPEQLALAAAEDSRPGAELAECMSGYDRKLLAIARLLADESAGGYPEGPLHWNESAEDFIRSLVAAGYAWASNKPSPRRGALGHGALEKIRDYIQAHLSEPIGVADLAALAGRSPFHFSRVFARSVGMTPHRYVIHLRLQAAIWHIRNGMNLAEVAASTGFADQSHLSRWIRRVYGVAPSQLA